MSHDEVILGASEDTPQQIHYHHTSVSGRNTPETKADYRLSRAISAVTGTSSVDIDQLSDDRREIYLALMREGSQSQSPDHSPTRTIFREGSGGEGSHSFRSSALCGKVSLSPAWGRSLLILFFAVLPEVGAFYYALARHSIVLIIPTGVLTLFTVVFLFACVFTEPGVIPRRLGQRPAANTGIQQWGHTCLREYDKLTTAGGVQVLRRWCSTCDVLRPPRASHCSVCNVCVNVFDHHCVVLGACIGERTLKYFTLFLFFATMLALWVGGICLLSVAASSFLFESVMHKSTDFSLDHAPDYICKALIGYCSISFLLLLPFSAMYAKNVIRGRTQRESEKRRYLFLNGVSPFDEGCCTNLANIFCGSGRGDWRYRILRHPQGSPEGNLPDPWAFEFPIEEPNLGGSGGDGGAGDNIKRRIDVDFDAKSPTTEAKPFEVSVVNSPVSPSLATSV